MLHDPWENEDCLVDQLSWPQNDHHGSLLRFNGESHLLWWVPYNFLVVTLWYHRPFDQPPLSACGERAKQRLSYGLRVSWRCQSFSLASSAHVDPFASASRSVLGGYWEREINGTCLGSSFLNV